LLGVRLTRVEGKWTAVARQGRSRMRARAAGMLTVAARRAADRRSLRAAGQLRQEAGMPREALRARVAVRAGRAARSVVGRRQWVGQQAVAGTMKEADRLQWVGRLKSAGDTRSRRAGGTTRSAAARWPGRWVARSLLAGQMRADRNPWAAARRCSHGLAAAGTRSAAGRYCLLAAGRAWAAACQQDRRAVPVMSRAARSELG
jgi:hypothetical protein